MRPAHVTFVQRRASSCGRSLILAASVAAAWTVPTEVSVAQEPASEPGRLRVVSTPAPWPRWPFLSATACGREVFVAARRVYVSRDGRRWRHARHGLPHRYHAASVQCIDGTAFVSGYPGLIARWEPESRRWRVEHAARVEDFGPIRSWPVYPYIGSMVREWTQDGERLRGLGWERMHEAMNLVRAPNGSWERVAPWTSVRSVAARHCETSAGPRTDPNGAIEWCGGVPNRVLLWRSPVSVGGPWPVPEEIVLPPSPPESFYVGGWWSPTAVMAYGPVLRAPPERARNGALQYDTDGHTHQTVTLYHRGVWRRTIVPGYEHVAGPVELGSSIFLFTSHGVYRVIDHGPESQRGTRSEVVDVGRPRH
jgi:hypothetical protein